MKTPRKIYMIVSRSFKKENNACSDVFFTRKDAQKAADSRNKNHWYGRTDANWRVESFVREGV